MSCECLRLATPALRNSHSVDLKRRPPKSLPWPHPLWKKPKPSPFEEAARKDSAVHVSLSSDSLFKHPGTLQSRLRQGPEPPKSAHPTWAIAHGRMIHRLNSEGLRGRAIAPGGGASKRAYIVFGYGRCQRFDRQKAVCGWLPNRTASSAAKAD